MKQKLPIKQLIASYSESAKRFKKYGEFLQQKFIKDSNMEVILMYKLDNGPNMLWVH
jgi:hypothetical protein